MTRKEFIAVLAILPFIKVGEGTVVKVAGSEKWYLTSFKIKSEWFYKMCNEANDFKYEWLDKICLEKCGARFKEVGYIDDDWATGMLTVIPFHRDQVNHYNEPAGIIEGIAFKDI